ncbi:MAG: hypothetical protein K5989_07990 [Lachnospiraceae bacterium]|nr:hypothetical protein [Lachnospiraceae bacterium]
MIVEKIYFDMDGVLADFDRGVRELCHMEPLNQMTSTEEEDTKLWAAVREVGHFYDKLEIIPGSDELLRSIMAKYGDKCEILTGIPKPHRHIDNAGEDKQKWMARHFGPEIRVNIVFKEQKKERCKGEGCILIDDYQKNIYTWRQLGGTGILFTDAASAKEELRRLRIM